MSPKTALVLRATGSQGKGVTQHLLKAGWTVHALVRDPEDDRALALKNIGATLFKGDLNDIQSIEAAIQGSSALFLNQMPSPAEGVEVREAGAILDVAKKAGVKHVVHSTTLPLNDPDIRNNLVGSVLAFAIIPKGEVEELVRSSGIPFTLIRPGYFMTNFTAPIVHYTIPSLSSGKFVNSFPPDTVLPLVDTSDIGAFATAAFEDPGRFGGKIISVAGEKLGIEDIVKQISQTAGKQVEIVYRTAEETEKESGSPLIAGQVASGGLAKLVDIEEVKTWGIPLTSFEKFLEKNRDAVVA